MVYTETEGGGIELTQYQRYHNDEKGFINN